MAVAAQPKPRHREDSFAESTLAWRHNVNYAGTVDNPWKVTAEGDFSQTAYTITKRSMDDVVTPDFYQRKAKGQIVNNPFESTLEITRNGVASVARSRITRYGTSPNYYYSGYLSEGAYGVGYPSSWHYTPLPSVPSSSCIDEAISDAWASISLNEAEILVQLAESQKTIYSLISLFKRARKILMALKKWRLKALGNEISPRELQNRWMEARYAIRPLMYDVKGVLKTLSSEFKSKRQTYRAYRYNLAESTEEDVHLAVSGLGNIYGNGYSSRVIEARAGVLTSIDSMMNLNSWGLLEPLQAGWELVPFSFIVDWFMNVGKVIASWAPKFGFHVLASWVVVTYTDYQSMSLERGVNTPAGNYYTDYFNISGEYSREVVYKYRTPNPSRPTLPVYSLNLDWKKFVDLGIIARQFGDIFQSGSLRI